jgi:hypothetical protein
MRMMPSPEHSILPPADDKRMMQQRTGRDSACLRLPSRRGWRRLCR